MFSAQMVKHEKKKQYTSQMKNIQTLKIKCATKYRMRILNLRRRKEAIHLKQLKFSAKQIKKQCFYIQIAKH